MFGRYVTRLGREVIAVTPGRFERTLGAVARRGRTRRLVSGCRSRRRLNLSSGYPSHSLVESLRLVEPKAETCHEMLKPALQSRNRPRCLPAQFVRQRALLFKTVPRHLCGRRAETAATRTELDDLLRVALF